MKSKEHLAMDYIFFRNPAYYVITLLPIISGIISFFFISDPILAFKNSETTKILEQNMLENYLQAAGITLSFVISYFVIFKWVLMKTNGRYGFWLTQGVSRSKYFTWAIVKMVCIVVLSFYIGFLFIIFLGGIKLSNDEIMLFLLLTLSSIFMIFSLAVLISELVTDPELAATIFLIVTGLNFLFNRNHGSFLNRILLSDRYYADGASGWGVFILTMVSAFGLFAIGFQIHLRRSIDL